MTRPERALQIWQLLIGAARIRQTLTYSMVADAIGMGAGTLSQPLELVMRYCERNGLPPLTVLVVNQETGQPGAGLSTLDNLNQDRERVFNYAWFQLASPRPEELVIPGEARHGGDEVAAKVVYEITMFRHAFDRLLQLEVDLGHIQPGDVMPRVGTGISTEEVIEASVFVECFLLHARVLRDFFCRPGSKPDDVTASEFVSEWSAPPVSDYPTLAGEKARLDKALAHLTTTRVQYDTSGTKWDLEAIRQELQDIIRRFLASLPTDKVAWFDAVR